jgi:PAS domain S-box-containing protein
LAAGGIAAIVTGVRSPAQAPSPDDDPSARLAAIVDSSDDAIVSKTLDGVITSWNRGAERIFGWPAAEAVGRHITLIIPDDRRAEEDDVLARIRRGEMVSHYETVRVTRDGRLRNISLTVSPVRNATGQIVGASKIARDVTERRRLEDERDRLLERERAARAEAESLAAVARTINTLDLDAALESIAESASVLLRAEVAALYRLDVESRSLVLVAAGGPLGSTLSRDVSLPRGTGLVWLAAERREAVASADLLADERLVFTAEMRARIEAARHRGGLAVPLIARAEVMGVLFVGTLPGRAFSPDDIRLATTFADQAAGAMRNAQLYQDAREANRAKDEFLAMLGHELRNPLGAIASAAGALNAMGPREPAAERARIVIDRQVQHLSRLVDDLLDVSRVTTGKVRLDRQPLELGELVASAMATWRAAGRFRQHHVAVDASPAWVEADETRIEQVLGNLVGNALKYTPAGGRITVRVARDGDDAVLDVADTGTGIPPNLAGKVFDLFVQGDRALDRAQGGLGIGLTLVKSLVTLHGGAVETRSGAGGQGTVFTVRLPGVPAPVGSRRAVAPPAPAVSGPGRRILVIEDNDDAREMLRVALTLAGHQVFEAPDGPAGLALAGEVAADVALIDVGLPGLDGYEVARRIRANGHHAMLLVAVTGYGQPEDRARAVAAGFDAHVTKPISPERLSALVTQGGAHPLAPRPGSAVR